MSPLSKKQAFTSIRDIILISLFIYVIEEYALSVENAQARYLFIALIITSLLYCILKFLSALLSSSIIVIRIGSYFHQKKNIRNTTSDLTILLSLFIYLYLLSINISAFEKINKIDFYLLIYKVISF
jgi:ABC-type Na+ efflux pump permease subunit